MTAPVRYAFNVDEWHRMGEAGLFDEDARVELLDGEVVRMSPIGSQHAACVKRLNRLFSVAVGERAVVSVQDPIQLDDYSEPQPDLALLRPHDDLYSSGHPRPEDVLLVVEVADTTLAWDRDRKADLYARAGIAFTWIVDLKGQEVLVLGDPTSTGYGSHERACRGDHVALPDSLDLAVDDVLGPLS